LTLLLAEMSKDAIARLDSASTIALLPLSPLEEHGPHLPVGTDLFLSESLARALGDRIEAKWPGTAAVLLPLVPLGSQVVSGPGSVRIRQGALHDLLFDIVRSLSVSGFRYILLCSVHGGIGHVVAQEEVAERAGRELGIRVEPALSRVLIPFLTGRYLPAIEKKLGRQLSSADRTALRSDCHGGQWETGGMLAIRPDLVDEGYRSLPAVTFSNFLRLRASMTDSCARGLGYVGAPSMATIEYALAANDVLQEQAIARVDEMLHAPSFRPSHTPFYYWPGYRTRRRYTGNGIRRAAAIGFAAGAAVGIAGLIAAASNHNRNREPSGQDAGQDPTPQRDS